MSENPYESPTSDLPEPPQPAKTQHRSFRLSSSSASDDSPADGGLRGALQTAIVQQGPLLLLSALLLDEGRMFRLVAIAAVAYWICVAMALVRRGRTLSRSDTLWMKWGYWPLLLITWLLGSLWNR